MLKKDNVPPRVTNDNVAGYESQMRFLNRKGNPESVWATIATSASFEAAYDSSSQYFDECRDQDDIHRQEFRIINPYGNEVALLSPPHQQWQYRKDDYADRDMSEALEKISGQLEKTNRRITNLLCSVLSLTGFVLIWAIIESSCWIGA